MCVCFKFPEVCFSHNLAKSCDFSDNCAHWQKKILSEDIFHLIWIAFFFCLALRYLDSVDEKQKARLFALHSRVLTDFAAILGNVDAVLTVNCGSF